MPTTQVTEITASIDTVAARTNSAGAGVSPDWKAEERRMATKALIGTPGVVIPANAYQVVAGGGGTMNIVVGSGSTKVDIAVLDGVNAGQGSYLVRLDEAGKTIALDAAHASLARVDEVYLVVYDHAYDGTSRVLPRLAVRKGDNGGGNPGPDASWDAYLLLSRVSIPGGAANIAACTFSDQRVKAKLHNSLLGVHTHADADQGGALSLYKTESSYLTDFTVNSVTMPVTASTPPTLGSGGYSTLHYFAVQKRLFGWGRIVLGSGMSGGSGSWRLNLATPNLLVENAILEVDTAFGLADVVGHGVLVDQSGVTLHPLVLIAASSSLIEFLSVNSNNKLSGTLPVTLAAGDEIHYQCFWPLD